jgi:exosortase E/protease (VPEID-CTERM system)
MLALLAAEAGFLIWRFEQPSVRTNGVLDPSQEEGIYLLLTHPKAIWQAALWCVAVTLLLLMRRLPPILRQLAAADRPPIQPYWLAGHALAYLAFLQLTRVLFDAADPQAASIAIGLSWFGAAALLLAAWLFTLAPPAAWARLITSERVSLGAGLGLGLLGWVLFRTEGMLAGQALWKTFAKPTLWVVYQALKATYPEVIYLPDEMVIGTPQFEVEVFYTCSGYEGISLILIFLSVYLWLFREELRFPQVFWLFPIGVIATYALNLLRVTVLIMIGSSLSPDIAIGGFHAQAGWISISLTAFGLIILLRKVPAFSARAFAAAAPPPGDSAVLATALLVPFLVMMATAMVVAATSDGFELLYPLKAVTGLVALWLFRTHYRRYRWEWSWPAASIGVAVFVMWLAIEPAVDSATTGLARGLDRLEPAEAAVWLAFRAFNSVCIVPLIEEFAFRGYLLRRLAAADFDAPRAARFSWFALIASSLLFGLLHGRWIAGTLAGMAYGYAFYRRARLADAVWAHLTTNLLIAAYALAFRHWSLWD